MLISLHQPTFDLSGRVDEVTIGNQFNHRNAICAASGCFFYYYFFKFIPVPFFHLKKSSDPSKQSCSKDKDVTH